MALPTRELKIGTIIDKTLGVVERTATTCAIYAVALTAVNAALGYFTEQFGPYPYTDLRLAEYPPYGGYGSAHPSLVAFAENFVSRVQLGETRSRLRIRLVGIRVQLLRKLAEGRFDLGLARSLRHPQDLVGVTHSILSG